MTVLPNLEAALGRAIAEHQKTRPRPRWLPRVNGGVVVLGLGSLVAVVVAIVALTAGGAGPATGIRAAVPAGARGLLSQLAVLRRPQTPADRSLAAAIRALEHRLAVNAGAADASAVLRRRGVQLGKDGLAGTIGSLTRRVAVIPGGQVFMVVYPQPAARGGDAATLVFVLNAPVPNVVSAQASGGVTATDLQHLHTDTNDLTDGCFGPVKVPRAPHGRGTISWGIVPDGITRVLWTFARQDRLGFVYPHPLTVAIPINDNTLLASVPNRTACALPDVVRTVSPTGRVRTIVGNPNTIDRITRPIRHGTPFGP